MKKSMKTIVSVSLILMLSGCGNSGSTETTSTKFEGDKCITTKTYIKITKKMLLSNPWYKTSYYEYNKLNPLNNPKNPFDFKYYST